MKQSNTLVSIIIPTYNMRRWVGEAVDSALTQTYQDIEVIVVDDGSADGTGDYLQERYSGRIRYVRQSNSGRGAARNYGLRLANGEYIQFLDADDILYPYKIKEQVEYLQKNPEYTAVYGDALLAYEDELEHTWYPGLRSFYISGDILEQEIHNPFLWPVAVLVRRAWVERVEGFDETLRSNEDWDLWLRIAACGARFGYLPGNPVGIYRRPKVPRGNPLVHPESGVIVLRKLECSLDKPSRYRFKVRIAVGRALFCYGNILSDNGYVFRGILTMLQGIALDRRSLYAKLIRIGLAFLPIKISKREAIFRWIKREMYPCA